MSVHSVGSGQEGGRSGQGDLESYQNWLSGLQVVVLCQLVGLFVRYDGAVK